jgi:hypothetical protein
MAAELITPGESHELIGSLLTRPDEPGDLLAHWVRRHGHAIPKSVKAGVADAAARLYDEVAILAYDTEDAAMRFAEVIALTHPKPIGKIQNEIFQYAARRASHLIPDSLATLRARAQLEAVPVDRRPRMLDRPDIGGVFVRAAMTWRQVRDWLGGAMSEPVSAGSTLTRADAAAVFGAALALRASSADLVECGRVTGIVTAGNGDRLIETVARFGEPGGGQTVAQALRTRVRGHDRVVVLTHPGAAVEAAEAVTVPGHEHIITDVNDAWFAAIPHIEMARTGAWPF